MECASANEIPASHLENGVASKDIGLPGTFCISVQETDWNKRSWVMAEQFVNPLRQVEVGVANGKLRYTDYPTGTRT